METSFKNQELTLRDREMMAAGAFVYCNVMVMHGLPLEAAQHGLNAVEAIVLGDDANDEAEVQLQALGKVYLGRYVVLVEIAKVQAQKRAEDKAGIDAKIKE